MSFPPLFSTIIYRHILSPPLFFTSFVLLFLVFNLSASSVSFFTLFSLFCHFPLLFLILLLPLHSSSARSLCSVTLLSSLLFFYLLFPLSYLVHFLRSPSSCLSYHSSASSLLTPYLLAHSLLSPALGLTHSSTSSSPSISVLPSILHSLRFIHFHILFPLLCFLSVRIPSH